MGDSVHRLVRLPVEDNAENRLKHTLFIVEANSNEQFMLWKDYAIGSDSPRHKPQKWEQVNPGWLVTVGELAGRPCCISVTWNRIEGHLVMFWYDCSQATDSVQTDAWLKAHFSGKWDKGTRWASCDAQNFHLCQRAISEANADVEAPAAGDSDTKQEASGGLPRTPCSPS